MPRVGAVSVELLFAFFLFAWWCVGAGIMTFQGPFTLTTNGYFATWCALVASAQLLGACMPDANSAQQAAAGLHVERSVFPATSAAHLAHDWPASMLKLVGHDAATHGG